MTPASRLLKTISSAAAAAHMTLKGLTVLATQNDPFRVDTPARHRDGEWLAITAQDLGLGDRQIHLRGLHYMLLGRLKPNGTPYTNTDADWTWLEDHAAKAARWLGYIPFSQVVDQRNAPAVIQRFPALEPQPYITVGIDVDIPDVEDITPTVDVDVFARQPYKLVFFGEKSSLADVLGPLAEARQADLYLPTGEISDTMLHQMAREGAADGRPMVVLCFSDADPAGWQMPISIGRKLQAFQAGFFPGLEFEVHRVALVPDQVGEYGLPSTPLKETERRADRWREAMGVEQTEIDALASLQPDLLRQIATEATSSFFDPMLAVRVQRTRAEWRTEAQAVVDESIDTERLEAIRADAAEKLGAMRAQIDEINDALRVDTSSFDLPAIEVPEADLDEDDHPLPLIDSRWSFAEQYAAADRVEGVRGGPVSRPPSPQLAAALRAADRGWRVFPAVERGKRPLVAWKDKATTDHDRLRAWWSGPWESANLAAVVPPGAVVVDVDRRHDGEHSLEALESANGTLPPTLTCITGSGGLHLRRRRRSRPTAPGRRRARSRPRHALRRPRVPGNPTIPARLRGRATPGPGEPVKPPPPRPGWWSDSRVPPRQTGMALPHEGRCTDAYGRAALSAEITRIDSATVGTRNRDLHLGAVRVGQLVATGVVDLGEAASALYSAGRRRGLDEREVESTIRSGMRFGMANPRGRA